MIELASAFTRIVGVLLNQKIQLKDPRARVLIALAPVRRKAQGVLVSEYTKYQASKRRHAAFKKLKYLFFVVTVTL